MGNAVNSGLEWSWGSPVSLPDVDEFFTVSSCVSDGLMAEKEPEKKETQSELTSALFHEAIRHGDLTSVSSMLSRRVDTDQVDQQGRGALEAALCEKRYDVAKLLLEQGVSPNTKAKNGMFLLQNAAHDGDNVAVDLLLAHGATINVRSRPGPVARSVTKTPLAHAIDRGHIQTARLITSLCPPKRLPALLNAQDMMGQTPLHQVASCRQYAAIGLTRIMLDNGAFVDAQDRMGRTPLFYAAESGNREMVRMLVHYHASLNVADVRDQSITGRSRAKGHIHVAKYLERKMKAIEEDQGVTCLYQAGLVGDIDNIRRLVLAGALVNMRSRNGLTILHGAAKGGHLGLVRFLVNSGACLEPEESQESISTQTALNMAAEAGNWDVTEFLLDAGSNPNMNLLFFRSPAFHAAQAGKMKILEKLFVYGCHMDQAMVGAARGGHLDIMMYLLDRGISIDSRERMSGLRAIDCALLDGHFHVATYLLKKLKVPLNVPTGHGDQYRSTLHCLLSRADASDATRAVLFVIQHGGRLQAVGDQTSIRTRPFNCPDILWNIVQTVLNETFPLSLRNNCRLTIRQCLRSPSSSVQRLPLPTALKSYLLFHY